MDRQDRIVTLIDGLRGFAPSGYAIALHVRFTAPTYLFQTYPRDWIDLYSQRGYLMSDPTVLWAFGNTGHVRWSDLEAEDRAGVLREAATHGMSHGITFATGLDGSQSLGSFSRADREYDADEVARIERDFLDLHRLTLGLDGLSPATAEALRQLSVSVTHP
ncbi:MAG: autoinducer binding domain-containing protein [Rubellimicrobium sp.]|nr:autoinducer binding domain-containing protein [Rubellimicrobium sp.]